jgi:hypothetical protein
MSVAEQPQPFRFVTHLTLTELTGRRAHDLLDLLCHLKAVPLSIVYYHTHHFLEQHHTLSPTPPNDFAFWVTHALQEAGLGERLASIDTIQFTSLAGLRDAIVSAIENHLATVKSLRPAPEGSDFFFMNSCSFVLPTPYEARTLEEFAQALQKVSVHSIYHHVFEARLRLGRGNDFAEWLGGALGEKNLAWQITLMDPYTQSMETLRTHMLRLVERRLFERQHVPA